LAANDVAKARAEREVAMVMQKPAPEQVPPQEASVPEEVPEQAQAPSEDDKRTDNAGDGGGKKRRRKRGGKGRDQNNAGSQEDAAPAQEQEAKQSEDDSASSSMTGKLILPTGEKPDRESLQPVMEKPKKLAPGEVYVDANGNVVTGD
jgi:hypothetical protein